MPSTYMGLTNRLLRRLNEVEIDEADFAAVRGIQATAKDCVLDAIREINTAKIDWPFNAVEHSQDLEVGVEEYAWPSDFTAADWNSFQLQKDDTLNIEHKYLPTISREEWYQNVRDVDYDSETDGRNVPDFVFPSHGQGWGVTPSPNEEYPIKYRYYKNPTDLDLFDDEVTIPNKFDYVIIAGALYHMNLFKENVEASQMMRGAFDAGLKNMSNMFLPNPMYIRSTIVNFGGGSSLTTDRMWMGR
jgi:hypothetical protein